jgi:hypothetical protein
MLSRTIKTNGMKKICMFFLFALLPMMASADESVEINGVWFSLDAEQNCATVVKNPIKYAGDVVIPGQVVWKDETYEVTSIAAEAFSGCPSLVSVSIGNGVKTMGKRAFAYDNALISVTIGDGVESISESAFYQCKALKYVTIGNSVTYIGVSAFHDCISLSSVIIGSSVASIDVSAFYGCSSLTDVYCLAESLPTTESTSFDSRYHQIATLHVPGVAYNDYFTTIPWSNFATITAIHDNEIVKCATPVISYANGKISYSSATSGAEFKSFLKIEGADAYAGAEIQAPISYTVSVFAVKNGCYRSDTATKTFTFSGSSVLGDLNGDGKVDVKDHVTLSDIILSR